jgi:hypothetical protein
MQTWNEEMDKTNENNNESNYSSDEHDVEENVENKTVSNSKYKPFLPQFKIGPVDESYSVKTFLDILIKSNRINPNFIVYVYKNADPKSFVISILPEAYNYFLGSKRLKFKKFMVDIKQHIHVKICYRCGKFNNECDQQCYGLPPKCLYCCQKRHDGLCTSQKCIACNSTEHDVLSGECPEYKKAKQYVESMTAYSSKELSPAQLRKVNNGICLLKKNNNNTSVFKSTENNRSNKPSSNTQSTQTIPAAVPLVNFIPQPMVPQPMVPQPMVPHNTFHMVPHNIPQNGEFQYYPTPLQLSVPRQIYYPSFN